MQARSRVARRYAHLAAMLSSLLGGVLLALSPLPSPASATVTTARSSPSYILVLGPVKTTSSTGKVVAVEMNASTVGYSLDVTVGNTSSLTGGEVHGWNLPGSASTFTFSPTNGKGSVSMTSAEEGPFGTTRLAFTTSSKTTSCGEGRYQYKEWKGTLKGTFVFKTGFWGTIGSSSFAKPATVTTSTTTRCKLALPPCRSGVLWAVSIGNGSGAGVGGSSGSTGFIRGERTVTLSSPAHASRTDILNATAPKPSWSGGEMKVSTPGGRITGSATIKAEGSPSTNPPFSCRSGTRTKTETDKFWSTVAYASPAGHAITFHLSGPPGAVFSLPQQFSGSRGYIEVSTLS